MLPPCTLGVSTALTFHRCVFFDTLPLCYQASALFPRDTGYMALDQTIENIRGRVHKDLRYVFSKTINLRMLVTSNPLCTHRYPPAAWLGDCRKEWIAPRFAARKAQGLDLSSADLFGGNISNYFLGDVDSRGTTLSEQRGVFASGAMPMPIYTCVRKDVESESALDWMPDEASSVCLLCGAEWASFAGLFSPASRSRHHCRSCGRLACGTCSTNRAIVGAAEKNSNGAAVSAAAADANAAKAPVRVCDDCFRDKRYETSKTKHAKNWCASFGGRDF